MQTKVRVRGVSRIPIAVFALSRAFSRARCRSCASDAPASPKRPLGAQIVCTLGPKSADLSTMEALLRAGMSVARFNFSRGSHEYHQGTLNTLRQAMLNTRLMCAVLLDTKGPEIRTGMLKGGKPVLMEAGREITIHTDYTLQGDEHNIAMTSRSPHGRRPWLRGANPRKTPRPIVLFLAMTEQLLNAATPRPRSSHSPRRRF